MSNIGVSEKNNRLIFTLKKVLGELSHPEFGIRLAESGDVFDSVLIGTPPQLYNKTFTSKTLIVPDCMNASELSPIHAESVISYGLRLKNTVTASSLIGEHLAVSIQRNIPTLCGNTVGEQEFIVNVRHGEHCDEILGIIATLLVIGISPEDISKITFDI